MILVHVGASIARWLSAKNDGGNRDDTDGEPIHSNPGAPI
jgi:hypothetical protein